MLAWTAEKLNIHPQGNTDVYSHSKPGMNQNIKSAKWRSCGSLFFSIEIWLLNMNLLTVSVGKTLLPVEKL